MAGKVAEGAVVAFEGAGQHNPIRSEGPLLHRCLREERCPRMPKANDVQRGRIDPTRRLQRKLYRAAKQRPARRFHALYDKVHRTDILWRAWQEVAKKRGAPGVDAASIEAIEAQGVESFLNELRAELMTEVYRPLPVRRVMIPKRTGGQRPLGVPSVRDRVVQTATKLVVEPVFEADFADCSYGFRPKRSALQAREHIRRELQWGRRWVVDADIRGFFDHLDHAQLLAFVRERVSDRRLLKLLTGWLRADVLTQEGLLHPEAGTPQGGVISPVLANVYLNRLDQAWRKTGQHLGEIVRYADDLVVLCRSERQAEAALQLLREMLGELGLTLAETKTRIVDCRSGTEGFDFLGYHFRMRPSRRGRLFAACWPSRAAMAAARERVRLLTPPTRIGRPAIMVVQALNRFLKGWGAYFRYGNSTLQFKRLDAFVFERVARFIARKHGWRNWRRGLAELIDSPTRLGLYRVAGTVRYVSAHATR
jgi:RNA-directed DNA polymerase